MDSMLCIGMAIAALSFLGLIGIGCIAGLLIRAANSGRGLTWDAFKERLPTSFALTAFLVTLGSLAYAVVLTVRHYGG
jgi:hypothetical protein